MSATVSVIILCKIKREDFLKISNMRDTLQYNESHN